MPKLRIVGSSVLIALATLFVGIGGYVVTAPLFMVADPVTGARNDPATYGVICLHLALAFVSAAVGFGLLGSPRRSPLDGAAAGALAGTLLCLGWITKEMSRGIPLAHLWNGEMSTVLALATACAGLGARAALELRRQRDW